jgi:glyoxylate reductase
LEVTVAMETSPARVLVTRHLIEGALDPLRAAGVEIAQRPEDAPWTHDELVAAAPGFDGILCLLSDRIDRTILQAGAGGQLRVIGNAAVGYDNIDVASAADLGIAVCNTPGVLDETTADLAFLLVLSATRLASEAERNLRAGRWTGWGFGDHLARDVHGRVLGLVGYGRIGRAVARRAEGFAMEVLHHTPRPTGFPGYVAELDELLTTADVISLHVPLADSTHHLIGARELALMKPTAVLINTARGAVVDEDALVDALETGSIFAAGLDVFDNEPAVGARLLAAPRTVLLPHIGSSTVQTRTRMGRLAAKGVAEVLAGRNPPNLVVA